MSTGVERRVLINTAVLGVGEAVGQLANFAFVVLFARRYGVQVFGWYSFAMALGAVLAIFVSLGGIGYVTRELARDPGRARAIFQALRPLQAVSGLFVWFVIASIAFVAGDDVRERYVIIVVGTYHVLLRISAFYLATAAARQRPIAVAIVGGGHRILVAVLASVAILFGCDAPVALLAMPVAALVALLAAYVHAQSLLPAANVPAEPISRRDVVRASLPFLGTGILIIVYSRGGLLLLTAMAGEVATGLYAAADRLLVPVYMVTTVFATALLPALATLSNEPERMKDLARRCLRLVLLISIPFCALLAIFAEEIVVLVFGSELHRAATILVLLAPLPILRSVTALWSAHCVAVNEEHRVALARTQTIVAFFALAAAGIALAGAEGLAVACILSECFLAVRLHVVLARHAQQDTDWRAALIPVAASLMAALAAAMFHASALPFRVLLVAAVLALALVLLGGVRNHDLTFLIGVMRGDSPTRRSVSAHPPG
jgi:O-antigen/teichoic acid export membrane protein